MTELETAVDRCLELQLEFLNLWNMIISVERCLLLRIPLGDERGIMFINKLIGEKDGISKVPSM